MKNPIVAALVLKIFIGGWCAAAAENGKLTQIDRIIRQGDAVLLDMAKIIAELEGKTPEKIMELEYLGDAKKMMDSCLALDKPWAVSIEKIDGAGLSDPSKVFDFLLNYHQCLAVAAGDPAPCQNLEGVIWRIEPNKPEMTHITSLSSLCEEIHVKMKLAKLLITKNSNFLKECESNPYFKDKPGVGVEVCRIVFDNMHHPAAISAKLSPLLVGPAVLEDFMAGFAYLGEGAAPCEKPGADPKFCRRMVLFKKAHEAHDPRLCGDDAVCLGMTGGGGARMCQVYAKLAKKEYCQALLQFKRGQAKVELERRKGAEGSASMARRHEHFMALARIFYTRMKEYDILAARLESLINIYEPKGIPEFKRRIMRRDRQNTRFGVQLHQYKAAVQRARKAVGMPAAAPSSRKK